MRVYRSAGGKSQLDEASLSHGKSSPITVIIPTYNRAPALVICLEHLERQTMQDFEVILVDDGSTDDTTAQLEAFRRRTPLQLRYLRQENSGPAKARNLAISQVRSPISLIIGDDIFASPGFVATHLRFHEEHPEECCGALGLTRWSESGQTVTPFMRWLDEGGIQFSYHDLLNGIQPSWRHFYTSNLSLKTELLRKNPFHEGFRKATMEDIELGYRLEVESGLRLSFLPEALAHHLHPTTFLQACRRLDAVGASVNLFHDLWPEHRPEPAAGVRRRLADLFHKSTWLLTALTAVADVSAQVRCPNPLMRKTLELHAAAGYRKGTAKLSSS